MNDKFIVWDELKFFLECLKFLPMAESISLSNNKGFCVSTGSGIENWVYWPDKITSNIADEIIKFFRDKKDLMWPIYQDNDDDDEILKSAGLVYAGNLTAMSLNPEKAITSKINPGVKIERVINNSQEWALTASASFGGNANDLTREYLNFVEALNQDRENLALYLAEIDDKPVGTFLLTRKNGVYYFGTLPEFRRKGVAASMMGEICKLSNGNLITLQATPMGYKFYKNFGFDELFTIKVYSDTSDIL